MNSEFNTEAWLHEQADRATNPTQSVRIRFIATCPVIFEHCLRMWMRVNPFSSRADYLRRLVNNFSKY